MKTARIVYAHPEPKSFVAAMRDTVQAALEAEGWSVTVSDLYARRFDPVASERDFQRRDDPGYLVYSLEQRHAFHHRALAPDIAEEVDALRAADLLVLVFPVFWFSVPAMLKGWIDRVFLSGLFYRGKHVYDAGGMAGKKAMVVTSLGGREHMFGPGAIHGDLHGMLRHLLQGTLGYVGYEVCEPFVAYHVPYVMPERRAAMLAELAQAVRGLEGRPCLPMPRRADFDDEFRPLASKDTHPQLSKLG